MYATDTRIGCGIMTPRIGCRLSLLRYHAAGEGASLFPVGAGEALRCLLLRTAEKALRCFPLTRFMLLQQKNLPPGGFSELCESGDS